MSTVPYEFQRVITQFTAAAKREMPNGGLGSTGCGENHYTQLAVFTTSCSLLPAENTSAILHISRNRFSELIKSFPTAFTGRHKRTEVPARRELDTDVLDDDTD